MPALTKELVAEHITDIPNRSDEELAYLFKCASSHSSKLLKPYEIAIAKERKKRGNIKPIVNKSIEEQVTDQAEREAYLNGDTANTEGTATEVH